VPRAGARMIALMVRKYARKFRVDRGRRKERGREGGRERKREREREPLSPFHLLGLRHIMLSLQVDAQSLANVPVDVRQCVQRGFPNLLRRIGQ